MLQNDDSSTKPELLTVDAVPGLSCLSFGDGKECRVRSNLTNTGIRNSRAIPDLYAEVFCITKLQHRRSCFELPAQTDAGRSMLIWLLEVLLLRHGFLRRNHLRIILPLRRISLSGIHPRYSYRRKYLE